MSDVKKGLHQQLTDPDKSSLQRYQAMTIGSDSLWPLIKYELILLLCSWIPGALGLVLRKFLYPRILGSVGRNVIFGHGVTIRHGSKVHLGDNVIVDDYVSLDAKGDGNVGITIGQDTIISRNAVLSCKNGNISIGKDCSIGINCLIHANGGSDVSLGDDVLVGAYTYLIGSGTYGTALVSVPFKKQGIEPQGGLAIADNVWIGSNCQILDGVSVGRDSIIGSSSVVNRPVGNAEVVAGIPARKIRSRT